MGAIVLKVSLVEHLTSLSGLISVNSNAQKAGNCFPTTNPSMAEKQKEFYGKRSLSQEILWLVMLL